MFASGGLAALALSHKKTFMGNVRKFIGNGLFIYAFGLILNMKKFND